MTEATGAGRNEYPLLSGAGTPWKGQCERTDHKGESLNVLSFCIYSWFFSSYDLLNPELVKKIPKRLLIEPSD